MASSSRPQPVAAMTDEDLINLTNALSLAMENDEGSSSDVDMQITRDDAAQTDITVDGKRISIMFERPDSAHLTRPGSIHGFPNPLGTHPPTPPPRSSSPTQTPPRSPRPPPTPSTCKDEEGKTIDDWVAHFPSPPAPPPAFPSYRVFPAPTPLPPKWFKHVRFDLTPEQIYDQHTPKPRYRESQVIPTSSLYDENEDDVHAKSVKFVLTPEQLEREGREHEKLVESEVVDVAEYQHVGLAMGKVEVLKSVVKHVLRRAGKGKGKDKDEGVRIFRFSSG